MKLNYKQLGDYIREVNVRNVDLKDTKLLGVSIQKEFIQSIANTIGTNMATYKIVKNGQFAYGPVTSRNGDKISIALLENYEEALISQAYTCFEVTDENKLLPQYLMMWFRRPEFDRYARYKSHGSVREIFSWEDMCDVELPIPSIAKQKEIVGNYKLLVDRINLNNCLIRKIEETIQTIYKQWFIDFEFPDENGKPYKANGGELIFNVELDKEIPKGWKNTTLKELVQTQYGFTATAEDNEVGPKFLRITDIAQEFINWDTVPYCKLTNESLEKYTLHYGDIVVARTGASVGFAKRINKYHPTSVFASYLVRLKPIDAKFNIYLGITIDSVKYREFIMANAEGSAQPQANANLMTEYVVLKPNDEVILKLNKLMEPILDLKEILQMENSGLKQLVDILLSKLSKVED